MLLFTKVIVEFDGTLHALQQLLKNCWLERLIFHRLSELVL
jgi:hypothetical protein